MAIRHIKCQQIKSQLMWTKNRKKHHNPRKYNLDIHESTKIEQNQPKIDQNSQKQNEQNFRAKTLVLKL